MIDVVFAGIVVVIAFIGLVITLRFWLAERGALLEKQRLLKESAKKVEHSSLIG